MTGGIIQLVAIGKENMFLTDKPQITFFKLVYRRHTNFSLEQIPQNFTQDANFGEKVTCSISQSGDLIGDVSVVVQLPKISPFFNQGIADTLTKFAWVRKLGHVLIKSVEIEINGHLIDRHYGEWLNILSEMFGPVDRGIHKLIGDVTELTDFSDGKDPYTLYIPLRFWFCKSSGLALPIIALQYSEVKINVEFNSFQNCYLISPTNYIKCEADIVNFIEGEYIQQVVNGELHAGIFVYYDIVLKRLYYSLITTKKILGIPSTITNLTLQQQQAILTDPTNQQYLVIGQTSGFSVMPSINQISLTYQYSNSFLKNVVIPVAYLLVEYIFVDDDERIKITQARHDYLIDQLFYTPNIQLQGANTSVNVVSDQPTELMFWIVQQNYLYNSKDYFNYTDSYRRKISNTETQYANLHIGELVGNSLVQQETLILNSVERLTLRDSDYFTNVQAYQYGYYTPPNEINIYSFALFPNTSQPSGSCNMSQMEQTQISLQLSHIISPTNTALFRAYSQSKNILRIYGGLGALVFTR